MKSKRKGKPPVVAVALLAVGVIGWSVMGTRLSPGRGPWDYVPPGDPRPLTLEQAAGEVRAYLEAGGYASLEPAEVMEFSNHFYAAVKETDRNRYAFELLVNRYTGEIFPEPGPNMMWNTKYGHMGRGMMGLGGARLGPRGGFWGEYRGWRNPDEAMPVSPAEARERAVAFLNERGERARPGEEADEFYGYYTLHYLENGEVAGMLSVNGYTGDVWLHTWHEKLLRMEEFGGHPG